jgi:F-type H+-transporting ATPase subunit b
MLDVHGGLLAWTVITFVLLLVVLKVIAWKPILSALDAREKEIKDSLAAAELAKTKAEEVSNDYEVMIQKAQAEALKIISDGKSAGEKIKADIEDSAKQNANDIINNAKVQINAEREKAIKDIQSVVVEISIKAAEKVIVKNLDTDDNRKIINDTLDEIGQA